MLPPARTIHHDRNGEIGLHVLLQNAREQVRRATGSERHHNGYRALGRAMLRLRRRERSKCKQAGNATEAHGVDVALRCASRRL